MSVFGVNVVEKPDDARRLISYLPEDAGAYKNLSGLDYLRFMATFYTQDNRDRDAMVEQGKEMADLGERIRHRVKTYSKGMARKLLLARALEADFRFAMIKGRRKQLILESKTSAKTKEQALADLDTSLKELGTDWLIFMLLKEKH